MNFVTNKQNIYIQEHSLARRETKTNIGILQQDILDQWKAIVDQQSNASNHMWCFFTQECNKSFINHKDIRKKNCS